MSDVLKHYGVKGMKWGVRKDRRKSSPLNDELERKRIKNEKFIEDKNQINSKDRTIKKGTSIQNITKGKYENRNRHMYASYTSYDNAAYVNLMAGYMYFGQGHKNNFVVKKDIRIPSDKKMVEEFVSLAKKNPKQVAKDMSEAHNAVSKYGKKGPRYFKRQISKIDSTKVDKGKELTETLIRTMVSDKATQTRTEFIGGLIKKGYDGISDTNDRNRIIGGMQDPLIIFNTSKNLKLTKSVALSSSDIEKYSRMVNYDKNFDNKKYDLNEVQR